jgi:hypothetical protein
MPAETEGTVILKGREGLAYLHFEARIGKEKGEFGSGIFAPVKSIKGFLPIRFVIFKLVIGADRGLFAPSG